MNVYKKQPLKHFNGCFFVRFIGSDFNLALQPYH